MCWESKSQTLLQIIKIEHIFGLTIWNNIQFIFNLCPNWGLPKYVKIKVLTTYFDLQKSFFFFEKKRSGTSLPASFSPWFLKTIFFMLYSINWTNLPLLLEILDNMWISIIFLPVCDVINFDINLSLLINPFFYMSKNSGQTADLLTFIK